ncbi:MAG: CBS domain-containing protein [Deltaproteobacteria bacterium]|nr:CBS domain-containing protein [Deltaproteobacteria bacterium]
MSDPIQAVLDRKGTHVEVTHPRMTVLAAVDRMNELHVGALMVSDGDRPLGILTERDVMIRVIARHLDPEATLVGEVMTRELVSIHPHATIAEAMVLMTDRRCRHLPVLEGDELRGILSIGDLMSWMVRDQERTIADLHDYICH